ncbi:GyrI-like domain-containing protein [Bacillus sp. FJAT-49732]|uniref:GyrI-like domain-containing protein n=1 Tax=Lederbergia citrisecunda TaxID=2833583 RepID=A0A942THG2_9BACI|nr:GyrI-like domain-containing protein [Lederbergia citrisecunda]MBS4198090.1 GyrI-like domain-containing protein [Lederbergia citrisecunda]
MGGSGNRKKTSGIRDISLEAELPIDMISYVFPKGTYAILKYHGDIDNAGSAYGELYEWINDSEYEHAGTFGFEMYLEPLYSSFSEAVFIWVEIL